MLKLPKGEPPKKGEKVGGATSSKKNQGLSVLPQHHLLEKIDLSGFRYMRFSRAGLKELVDGI